MKGFINFSLKNKLAIWILTIILIFTGLYSGLTMKQETIPNINVPFLSVNAVYPGAAPEAVVEEVTKPLEETLRNVEGIKNITSTSMENVASVNIEFDYGTNLDNATAAVREVLNDVQLPDDAQKPSISKFSINSFPVASISLSGKNGESLEDLTRIAENDIAPAFEDVDGVASVQISGQFAREVTLNFDDAKMAELGLTQETVQNIVQASSMRAPLGLFNLDDAEKAVVVDGNIISIEDLENIEIPAVPSGAGAGAGAGSGADAGAGADADAGAGAGADAGAGAGAGAGAAAGIPTVKLSEIADIEVIGQAESISRTNGAESLGFAIVKANDANTVDVVNGVKDASADLEGLYDNINLDLLLDQGQPIEDSVHTMLSKALYGALFAIIIILIFLRDWRSTLISVISIPLSLLIALTVLNLMDITLNVMTLGAMTVAIGRVVDDSIVVIENIYRRLAHSGEKLKGRELILSATREMFVPIMSSTIVTIAVFLPLALVSGMVGELFMPFALTMVFALLASLVVAITIVPAMAHSLFRGGIKNKVNHDEKPGKMAGGYKKILNWTLNHKSITIIAAVLLLVGSLFLTRFIGTSFIPEQGMNYTLVTYSPEPGATQETVEERTLEVEEFILNSEGVKSMQYSVGGGNPMAAMGGSSNSGLFYLIFEDGVSVSEATEPIIEGLQERVPEGEWSTLDMASGMGGNTLTVSVFGDDVEQIKPVADDILEVVKSDTENFEKAESTLEEGYDQYTLVADQQKLSSLGLTAGQLAMALAPQNERPVLTEVEVDGKNYNVYIETEEKQYASITEIEEETLTSPLGIEVPIGEVATVEEGTAPASIMQIDGETVVQVTANILSADVGSASGTVEEAVNNMELPEGVHVEFGGVTEQINETFSQLGLAMLAAIAIVYFVLVVTFGGGLAPFAILFSLPFTVIGALVGLLITGETLNVSSLMGGLMLIGIVVTNAIVLIDRVIHKENEGMSTREALLEAGTTRLRPILMTALATIGALLPLVFGWENSAGIISKGLGVTVIGGLISSTLLTLVIVPIVYEILSKFKKKRIED
ncbi:efflux RND transporter permease subunit [Paenibacillus urinalis]|uniref:Efflux RND transporter permease subunit n=1 Tax=Paenibacillus urinalis TaxID=521520 RepID=A0ABY7XBR4_9BACL|nr:efflux RND transporter permease subunit [Paenibacillus urinalis]WDH98347.1 efflux RND transporter permease subunit [Paenibacillus urinalis]WDI02037.1 efflux RND transporter permease subunit [Paenibacillus urinalis]